MLRKGESSQAFYFWRYKKFIKWGYTKIQLNDWTLFLDSKNYQSPNIW